MMPTVRSCLRYSRASWSTSVLLPAPGAPVSPITRARPLCGNTAFSREVDSGRPSSIMLMALARARTSPWRIRSTQDWIEWVISEASLFLILQQLPRDHQSLNLAGAFANRTQLHVAIEFFRGIILDEPVPSMNLHRFIRALHCDFAGKELGHGGFHRGLQARVLHAGG